MRFNLLLKLVTYYDVFVKSHEVFVKKPIIFDRLHSHLWTKCSCLELTEGAIHQNQDNHHVLASFVTDKTVS